MEGIYQNNLYSSQQQPSYVLSPSHPEHTYSHYGNQYRPSAFSDARSCQPTTTTTSNNNNTTSTYHSAGLNAVSSNTNNNSTTNNYAHSAHGDHHNDDSNYNNTSTSSVGWSSSSMTWNTSPPPLPPPSSRGGFASYPALNNNGSLPHMPVPMQRPKLTTTVWEDEGTLCYQVDAKSVCVARRQGMFIKKYLIINK